MVRILKRIVCIVVAIVFVGSAVRTTVAATADQRGLAVVEKNHDTRTRVALVIGNSGYRSSPLKNPANDAHAMASSLRRLGFEVDEKTNLGYTEMNNTVESFGRMLKSGGVGLFYYAGHGMQVNGANYLIPVDAQIEDENEVRYKAVDVGLVLAKMEQAKSNVNIVVLDACRDNPFSRSFRSTSRGLASIDAPSGTFIAYATAPGKTAADGDGINGLYTAELVKILETPGIPLEQVFKRTLRAVREKSGSKQTPWVASNLEGEFYFTSPSSMTDLEQSSAQPALVQTEPVVASAVEPVREQQSELIYTDPQTGLMWPRNGNISGKKMDWDDAKSWAKNLNYGGYTDWRLPTKEELTTLAKLGGNRPWKWFNVNGFNSVEDGWYWSATEYNTYNAWYVNMNDGRMGNRLKNNDYYVWSVRGGQ
ncbi:MAG: caspase family protein [Desulfuromonadales bacterium]